MIREMDYLWAIIVIVLIFFILFVALPSLMKPAPPQPTIHSGPTIQRPVHPAGPSIKEQQIMEATQSRKMLEAHYNNASQTVPEDHPLKPIGACPYSKPPSTDLPMSNVPMCVAVQSENMHLRMPPMSVSI